ncbi:hypothetical protein DFH08DRAFT_389761 [Mycena albidolilacea]|uniref:Uncharacterized protein n=1 Tax=Mycena albidolilacea TaxID=1033008 RepID=A0AAD6ZEE3_9AGAR|nr:hypothetical protein DFH08DRAFT_389761 [Mycena albidolilacea]
MHCDYSHCPPPVPVFCSSTTRNTICSVTTMPLSACSMRPAPTTSPQAWYIAPAAVPRPHPQHQAPPFLVAHAAFVDPAGAATIFSGVATLTVLRARLRAPQRGCATPPPCATRAASIPHRICRFPRLPPVTTIFGAAPPLSSMPAPLAQPQLPSAPPPAWAALAVTVLHQWRRVLLLPTHYDHRYVASPPPRSTIDAGRNFTSLHLLSYGHVFISSCVI